VRLGAFDRFGLICAHDHGFGVSNVDAMGKPLAIQVMVDEAGDDANFG